MLIEGQLGIKEYPKMLGGGFSGHGNTIEREGRVDWFVVFRRKDDFNCLLGNVGVEHHFPLVGPLRDFVQVFREEAMGGVHVGNTNEEGGVISEEFDVRRLEEILSGRSFI